MKYLSYIPHAIKVFCFIVASLNPSITLAQENKDIRLSGSSTVAPVMLEIGKLFHDVQPETRVFVETGGSGKGIVDLRKGLNDIAMVSRELKPDELDLTAYTIALDGIAALVHSSNPVDQITQEQMRMVFTGKISNWSELGGLDRDIIVITKGEGRATAVVMNNFLGVTADQIDGSIVAPENAQMIKTVSLTPDSIGYVSIGAASVNIELGVPVKMVALGNVPATLENVADRSYQVSRPLNLVTIGKLDPSWLELIDYSKTEAVVGIIRELHYVPVKQ